MQLYRWVGSLVVVVSLFLSGSGKAAVFDPKLQFETIRTEHFHIHFPKELQESAKHISRISEEVHAALSPKLDWKPWGKTHVILIDNRDEANGLASVLPNNYLILYLSPPRADSTLLNYSDYLSMLFIHEYTHILHLDAYDGIATPLRFIFGKIVVPNAATPGWIREGWATYQESDETGYGRANSSYTDMVLRTDLLDGKFLPIDQASGVHPSWPGTRTQYLYGAAFWRWLTETYGEERVRTFHTRNRESIKLFAINSRAKKVFGKSFYTLWKDWETELRSELGHLRAEIPEPTETEPFIREKQASYFTWSPNGRDYVVQVRDTDGPPRIETNRIPENGKRKARRALRDVTISGQFSFSPTGSEVATSAIQKKRYSLYSALFIYDFDKARLAPVLDEQKNVVRGFDPDFHPHGQSLVYVAKTAERDALSLYDREKKSKTLLAEGRWGEQFFNPRFSPDGRQIALIRLYNGQFELTLFDLENRCFHALLKAPHHLLFPTWQPNGQSIVISSDRNDIYNLYDVDLATQTVTPLTNTLSGIFQPAYRPDGSLYAQVYTEEGFEIHKITPPAPSYLKRGEVTVSDPKRKEFDQETLSVPTEPYSALTPSLFTPRYLLPLWAVNDNDVFVGVVTGSHDPLFYHLWDATVNYRSGPNFPGFAVSYIYNRFNLRPYSAALRYSVNFGDVFGTGEDFYEERWRAALGASYPVGAHVLGGNYFFEDRSAYNQENQNIAALNLGRYSGIHLTHLYRYKLEKWPMSISLEKGLFSSTTVDMTDEFLGSDTDNEQRVFVGDMRYFYELPWSNHHVLALRGTGGITFGDDFVQRTFVLGGDLGESPLAQVSRRTFSLRGVPFASFSGERAMVFSAEYRFPLVTVERGIGTLPLFLNRAHLGLFADYGDIFDKDDPSRDNQAFFEEFMLGVGGELRGDFVIGHGLPIMGRLGYGILVINRDRVQGLVSDLGGNDAEYGTVIVQLGTSF